MHRSLAFQLVLIKVQYCISLQYNGGHDLVGSALNVELTISKRMPVLLRLKLHIAIGVLLMKAHIVPRH